MSNSDSQQRYTMGRSENETQRLIKQSQLYEGISRNFLETAGISSGMKVLDIGSGAGDVAMLVAEIVGSQGQVVGVDVNPEILKIARSRADAVGLKNIEFMAGDVREMSLDSDFDAVVGRLVLMYIPEAEKVLKDLVDRLKPNGIVAFQEVEMTPYLSMKDPDTPHLNSLIDWTLEVFRRTGGNTAMGLSLYKTFKQAGLPDPIMHFEAPVGCSDSWPGFDYVAQSFKSMLPLLVDLKIATAEEVGVDTLAETLKKEVKLAQRPFFLPPHVTAYAIKTDGSG